MRKVFHNSEPGLDSNSDWYSHFHFPRPDAAPIPHLAWTDHTSSESPSVSLAGYDGIISIESRGAGRRVMCVVFMDQPIKNWKNQQNTFFLCYLYLLQFERISGTFPSVFIYQGAVSNCIELRPPVPLDDIWASSRLALGWLCFDCCWSKSGNNVYDDAIRSINQPDIR